MTSLARRCSALLLPLIAAACGGGDSTSGPRIVVSGGGYLDQVGIYSADADAHYLLLGLEITNASSAEPVSAASGNFSVTTDAGVRKASSGITMELPDYCRASATIEQGAQLDCAVGFEILKVQQPVKLHYLNIDNQQTEVTLDPSQFKELTEIPW